jgi:hypothetical protein
VRIQPRRARLFNKEVALHVRRSQKKMNECHGFRERAECGE